MSDHFDWFGRDGDHHHNHNVLIFMERKTDMHNLGKKIIHATIISFFIFTTLFFISCGDSETAKEVTTAAKKAVEGEVAKQKEEIRKKVDQVINLDAIRGQKEDKQRSDSAVKEKSERDSHQKPSDDDKD